MDKQTQGSQEQQMAFAVRHLANQFRTRSSRLKMNVTIPSLQALGVFLAEEAVEDGSLLSRREDRHDRSDIR